MEIDVTGEKPSIKSFEDYSVLNGKNGLSRDEYKAATFHNSTDGSVDASFSKKADLMGTSAETLEAAIKPAIASIKGMK